MHFIPGTTVAPVCGNRDHGWTCVLAPGHSEHLHRNAEGRAWLSKVAQ